MAARTAPAFVDRLWSVVSAEPLPTMADVEAAWQQELSSRRPLDGLPQIPDEPSLTWKERLAKATAKLRSAWRRWFGRRTAVQPSARSAWPKIGSELAGFLWTVALVVLLLLVMQWIDPLFVLVALGVLWLLFQGLRGFGGAGRAAAGGRPAVAHARSKPGRWAAVRHSVRRRTRSRPRRRRE